MNKTLETLLKKYGTELVIARVMEQLRLLVESEDEEVIRTVKELVREYSSDTEYIFNLCEYSNLLTYVSPDPKIVDDPWREE